MINHHVPRMEAMERDWEEGIDALFMMSHLLRIELRIERTSTVLASALLFYGEWDQGNSADWIGTTIVRVGSLL